MEGHKDFICQILTRQLDRRFGRRLTFNIHKLLLNTFFPFKPTKTPLKPTKTGYMVKYPIPKSKVSLKLFDTAESIRSIRKVSDPEK